MAEVLTGLLAEKSGGFDRDVDSDEDRTVSSPVQEVVVMVVVACWSQDWRIGTVPDRETGVRSATTRTDGEKRTSFSPKNAAWALVRARLLTCAIASAKVPGWWTGWSLSLLMSSLSRTWALRRIGFGSIRGDGSQMGSWIDIDRSLGWNRGQRAETSGQEPVVVWLYFSKGQIILTL